MKAIGKNIKGETVEFDYSNGRLFCNNRQLTELVIPVGCKKVWCFNNKLTELIIPFGCERVWCSNNQLTELIIPVGCKEVWCDQLQLNGDTENCDIHIIL